MGFRSATSWIAFDRVNLDDPGCTLQLAPGTCLINDDFVKPELRRRHVLVGLAKLRSRHLLAAGCARSSGLVAPENVAACQHLRSNRRAVVGTLSRGSLGPFGRTRLQLDPAARGAEPPPFGLWEAGMGSDRMAP